MPIPFQPQPTSSEPSSTQNTERGEANRPHANVPARLSPEERLLLLEENVTDYAIFTIDVEGCIASWNVGACIASWNVGAERILGYQEAEIIGQPVALIFTPEDRAHGVVEQELSKATVSGRAEDERWHMRQDGSRFWASGVMTALRDEAGNLRAFAKILRDFTKRKAAETRQHFIAGAATLLTSSLDYQTTL